MHVAEEAGCDVVSLVELFISSNITFKLPNLLTKYSFGKNRATCLYMFQHASRA
jgi:hypothetical protein